MLVVDDADERLLLGNVGEQAEDSERHQEAVRRRAGGHPERDTERITLRRGETIQAVEHR